MKTNTLLKKVKATMTLFPTKQLENVTVPNPHNGHRHPLYLCQSSAQIYNEIYLLEGINFVLEMRMRFLLNMK